MRAPSGMMRAMVSRGGATSGGGGGEGGVNCWLVGGDGHGGDGGVLGAGGGNVGGGSEGCGGGTSNNVGADGGGGTGISSALALLARSSAPRNVAASTKAPVSRDRIIRSSQMLSRTERFAARCRRRRGLVTAVDESSSTRGKRSCSWDREVDGINKA